MRKAKLFLIGMAGVLLAFGMTGCDSLVDNAKKMADAVSDYTLTLAKTTDGQTYTAELYSNNVAVGGGVAKAASGSAIIKLTPYNGKPAFSGGTYKVRVTSGSTVKEKASVAFTTGGNTPLDWDTMTVITAGTGDGGSTATGLNITFRGGEPGTTYYIAVYDTFGDDIASLDDIYDYEYPLIAAGELIDGAGTLPDAPTLTGEYYVVIDDEDYFETLGGLVYFDNGNANVDLSSLTSLLDGGGTKYTSCWKALPGA